MSSCSVLLTTEGTYPYQKGGVSTWCDSLTRQLPEVDFTLLALTVHPCVKASYALHDNVRRLITVPLWGIERSAEFRKSAFAADLDAQWRTTEAVIAEGFVPPFERFLREISGNGGDVESAGSAIVAMHDYFQRLDYDVTMRSEPVWDAMSRACTKAAVGGGVPGPAVGEIVGALRLLYHLLQTIAVPVQRYDVAHSSAAAFCGLPCIIAKLKYQVPYLLTEHGVYVREQYLALRRSIKSTFLRQFMCGTVNLVAKLNYHYADLVAPVCAYNARWEEWWGVPRNKIRVIFNGADPERFAPGPAARSTRPVVATVGLIYPLKGQLDLIAAAAHARDALPDVEFRLYGAASDEEYFAACRASVAQHNLAGTVRFAGQTASPWDAYREADVVAMASVSEAFPYSIIEAMLTGSAVVATDVGGVREALADTGIVVPPRQPRELAAALVSLLRSPAQRRRLGEAARLRAVTHFTVQTFAAAYRQAYQDLTTTRLWRLAPAS